LLFVRRAYEHCAIHLSPTLAAASPLVVCQASLRALTGAAGLVARQCLAVVAHRDQVRASTLLPSGVPLELDWLAALAAPIANFFSPEGHERVLALLRLHHHVSRPASGDFDALSTPARRAAAFELARTLPFFDRDLTAYYTAASPIAEEYELRVAHSLMRLEPADRAFEAFVARADLPAAPKDPSAVPLWRRLTEVKCPLLLIYGRNDRANAYERAMKLKEVAPQLDLHITPDCKHLVPWDAQADVERLTLPVLA
jgi:pimeloyl-ACP methyl ester carboxylesterase